MRHVFLRSGGIKVLLLLCKIKMALPIFILQSASLCSVCDCDIIFYWLENKIKK